MVRNDVPPVVAGPVVDVPPAVQVPEADEVADREAALHVAVDMLAWLIAHEPGTFEDHAIRVLRARVEALRKEMKR